MDSVRPARWHTERPGRWIAETGMAVAGHRDAALSDRARSHRGAIAPGQSIASPQDCGMAGGEYCAIWPSARNCRATSAPTTRNRVCFDSAPLDAAIDIVGAPEFWSEALGGPAAGAMVAVRLCDMHPDGASTLITYGVLNLMPSQRRTNSPSRSCPARPMEIALKLDDVAYRVPAGHRLRVADLVAYWPMVWPSPEPVTLTLHGGDARRCRRVRWRQATKYRSPQPEGASPWAIETMRESANSRHVERDEKTGMVRLAIVDDFGEVRDLDHGLVNGGIARESWTIHPDDPLSASWQNPLDADLVAKWMVGAHRNLHRDAIRRAKFPSDRPASKPTRAKSLVFERDFDETIAARPYSEPLCDWSKRDMRFTPRHVAIGLADAFTLRSIFPSQQTRRMTTGRNQQSEELFMSNELEFLSRASPSGKLSRRDFLGRAAALGVTATFANSLLSSAARAEGPVKGGT